jgi:beta-lactamase class A
MRRRQFLASAALLAGSAAAVRAPALAAAGDGQVAGGRGAVPRLLDGFIALPGTKSAQIDVDAPLNAWRVTHEPDAPLFCGSCFKTFVLAAYLQEVEAERLSESEQLAIDDTLRSVGGGVFEFLSGKTQARNVLEAMIAHSDNTATDVAMQRVGVARVREFLANAALRQARVPDSTRRFFSYVAGYPVGEDMGWKALDAMQSAPDTSAATAKFRPPINDEQTMICPASEFVSYYKRALAGAFFGKPETLREFKRIQAMADAIAFVIPADTPAYMKGGSIDWSGFHCMATAGQMIVGETPVTFCLTLNWSDSDGDKDTVAGAYKNAVADIMRKIHKRLLEARA